MKSFWTLLPLLIIVLAATVLWKGGDTPTAAISLNCADLAQGCATRLRGRLVSVGTSGPVKPLAPFQVWVKAADARKIQAKFTMQGMDMGFNLYTLHDEGGGVFRERVTLPACVSGRRDWVMTLEIDGAVLNVPFRSDF